MAIAATETATTVRNSLEGSLNRGFSLNDEELENVVTVMRTSSVNGRIDVIIPPKMMTPSTKGLSFEEKQAIRADVDAFNEERIAKIEVFLGKFLPDTTASLLASRLKPNVEGLVVLRCPTDQRYTLIVEHS